MNLSFQPPEEDDPRDDDQRMIAAHDTQAVADIAAANKILSRLCDKGLVSMSIPVRDSDEDMILSRVIALASRLQEQEGQPALSERTSKDYAIEHAEYMAVAAERLSDAVNLLAVAHRDEHDDPDIEKAQEAVDESLRAVRDRVYEFRKRRDRATLAAGSQAVQVPGWRPIETAPKDGTMIMLGRPAVVGTDEVEERCAISTPGYWQEGWEDSVDDMGCDDGFVDCQHQEFSPPRSFGAEAYRSLGTQPTHWMPMPAAPLQPLAGGEVR